MRNRVKILLVGLAIAAAALIPAVALAGGGASDENDAHEIDVPITGPELTRASEVAINHLGGGTVTATEIEDEESYYEVEVTFDDGRQVDVQLDEQFNVVGTEDDGKGADD